MILTKLLYGPNEAAHLLSLGRTTVYEALASGELRSVKVGTARRIPADALIEYAERLTQSPLTELQKPGNTPRPARGGRSQRSIR